MPAYLFDLDGTLLDSSPDITGATNAARAAFERSPLTVGEVSEHIGWGLGHLLTHTLSGLDEAQFAAARAVFVAYYQDHLLDKSELYPGVTRCLDHLRSHPLGLVTNKPGFFLEPTLKGLAWETQFGVVVAGDTLPVRKPRPEPIFHALQSLGVGPENAVFVGDSEVDRDAARAAGVGFVAVKWGRVATRGDDRDHLPQAWLAPLVELVG